MRKFIFKTILFLIIAFIVIIIRIVVTNHNNITTTFFKKIPLNNISNSICFKAKADHIVNSSNFKHCTFLIAGSSMSLNNISGSVIHKKTNECVYNISSVGIKPEQLKQLLKTIKINGIKHLLLTFNNRDFGKSGPEIDYDAVEYYIYGTGFNRYKTFVNRFNINTFSEDWDYKYNFSSINNHYKSINFDEYGSVLLNKEGFAIDKNRWNEAYEDTTGFKNFYNNIDEIENYLKKYNVNLFISYLPSRPYLLTKENILQNAKISTLLTARFGNSFIDLQNLKIPANQYCDGIHLFKEGAEAITNSIIDSLMINKKLNVSSNKLQVNNSVIRFSHK